MNKNVMRPEALGSGHEAKLPRAPRPAPHI
jgi:hypothetical protein